MPVLFYVDPEIDDDPRLAGIDTVTLSYTFFLVDDGEKSSSGGGGVEVEEKEGSAGSESGGGLKNSSFCRACPPHTKARIQSFIYSL